MTTIDDVTLRVIDALNAAGAAYMIVGSFSSNAYGIPRSTKAADFVLQLSGDFPAVFYEKLGQNFEIDPQLKFETNTGTFKQKMRFAEHLSPSSCFGCPMIRSIKKDFGGG